MTADERPSKSLTLWEKLSLTWLVPLFAARCIKFLLFQRNPSFYWRQNLALALLKLRRATYPTKYLHLQARRVPTGKAIELYVAQHPNIAHTTVTVPLSPASNPHLKNVPPPILHFLTPIDATTSTTSTTGNKTTLLYFHGGGFVNPLRAAGHMPLILSLHKASNAHQTIILEYALAPEHPYPAQLIQAVAALRYLLTNQDLSLSPSDIILAGDSAGGQLVGALLAHLAKPSPYAHQVEGWKDEEDQFKAAVFISPWVSMQRAGDASMFEKAEDKWDGKAYPHPNRSYPHPMSADM